MNTKRIIFVFAAFCMVLSGMAIGLAKEDTWTKKTDMPTARNNLSTSAVNGKIYAIRGKSNVIGRLSRVEEYDPATDTRMPMSFQQWRNTTQQRTHGRGKPTCRLRDMIYPPVNGKIYAIGGAIDKQQHAITEVLSIVEYNTGFGGQSVEASGKLATTWGKLKAAYKKRKQHMTRQLASGMYKHKSK